MRFGPLVRFNDPVASGTDTNGINAVEVRQGVYLITYQNRTNATSGHGQLCARVARLTAQSVEIGPEFNTGYGVAGVATVRPHPIRLDDNRVACVYARADPFSSSVSAQTGGAVIAFNVDANYQVTWGGEVPLNATFVAGDRCEATAFCTVDADRIIGLYATEPAGDQKLALVGFTGLTPSVLHRVTFWNTQVGNCCYRMMQVDARTFLLAWRSDVPFEVRYSYINLSAISSNNIDQNSGTFRNDWPSIQEPDGVAMTTTPDGNGAMFWGEFSGSTATTKAITFTLPANLPQLDWSSTWDIVRTPPYRSNDGTYSTYNPGAAVVGGADAPRVYIVTGVDQGEGGFGDAFKFYAEAVGILDSHPLAPAQPFEPVYSASFSPLTIDKPDAVVASGGRGIVAFAPISQPFGAILPINPGTEAPLRWRQRRDCLEPGSAMPCWCLFLGTELLGCIPPFWIRITTSVTFGGRVGPRNNVI